MSTSPRSIFGACALLNLSLMFNSIIEPVLNSIDVSKQERQRIYRMVVKGQGKMDRESFGDPVQFVALPIRPAFESRRARAVRWLVYWGARYLFRESIVKRSFYY